VSCLSVCLSFCLSIGGLLCLSFCKSFHLSDSVYPSPGYLSIMTADQSSEKEVLEAESRGTASDLNRADLDPIYISIQPPSMEILVRDQDWIYLHICLFKRSLLYLCRYWIRESIPPVYFAYNTYDLTFYF
jgi:hypothetical protein